MNDVLHTYIRTHIILFVPCRHFFSADGKYNIYCIIISSSMCYHDHVHIWKHSVGILSLLMYIILTQCILTDLLALR